MAVICCLVMVRQVHYLKSWMPASGKTMSDRCCCCAVQEILCLSVSFGRRGLCLCDRAEYLCRINITFYDHTKCAKRETSIIGDHANVVASVWIKMRHKSVTMVTMHPEMSVNYCLGKLGKLGLISLARGRCNTNHIWFLKCLKFQRIFHELLNHASTQFTMVKRGPVWYSLHLRMYVTEWDAGKKHCIQK